MKVFWTREAERDRRDICDYIATDNPSAAAEMDERFSKAAASLSQFPQRGRPGKIVRTRELYPHKNYRLVYEVDDDEVWILALVHVARQWPPVEDDSVS